MTYHSSSCFLGFSHISLFLNPLCHAPISGPLHVLSFFFFPIWNPLLPSSWLAPILFYSNVTTLTALFKEYSSLITSSLLYQTYHELSSLIKINLMTEDFLLFTAVSPAPKTESYLYCSLNRYLLSDRMNQFLAGWKWSEAPNFFSVWDKALE